LLTADGGIFANEKNIDGSERKTGRESQIAKLVVLKEQNACIK